MVRSGQHVAALPLVFALAASTVPRDVAHAQPDDSPPTADSGAAQPRPALPGGVVLAGLLVGTVGAYAYFDRVWWTEADRADEWFVRDDWHGLVHNIDKAPHFAGGYHLTRVGAGALEVAGMPRGRALAWGTAYAAVFGLQVEVMDGFQRRFGFSPSDVAANAGGIALRVAQHRVPSLRAVRPTISYRPSYAYRTRKTPQDAPTLVDDYAGQTYWMSVDVESLLPPNGRSRWPGFVRASVGYSITDSALELSRPGFRPRPEVLLTLDLDASRLPGRGRTWSRVKQELAFIHLPSPALRLAPGVRGFALFW